IYVAAFAAIAYSTANRQYYSQFDAVTSGNLNNTILNVTVYCLLKTLSFCIMCYLLSRRLELSSIRLVAFTLVDQFEAVFSKFLLWSDYTTITSIRHSGPDFTFKFAWLHQKATE
ncbi:hypothetical protein PHYSODRAFT_501775, partial [Phytophthora sojae]